MACVNLDSVTVTPQQRRASIVDAAIRILDRDGADALNMRLLAEEMDLRPMAVYHYVSSKAELLSMVIAEVTSRVKWHRPRGGPRDRLLAQLYDTYAGLAAIPWLPELLHQGASTGVPPYAMIDAFISTANDMGLNDEQAYDLWRAVWSLIGFELQWHEVNRAYAEKKSWLETVDPSTVEEKYPALARVLPVWSSYAASYDVRTHIAALVDGTIARYAGEASDDA